MGYRLCLLGGNRTLANAGCQPLKCVLMVERIAVDNLPIVGGNLAWTSRTPSPAHPAASPTSSPSPATRTSLRGRFGSALSGRPKPTNSFGKRVDTRARRRHRSNARRPCGTGSSRSSRRSPRRVATGGRVDAPARRRGRGPRARALGDRASGFAWTWSRPRISTGSAGRSSTPPRRC